MAGVTEGKDDKLTKVRECMEHLNRTVFDDMKRKTMSSSNRRCVEELVDLSYDLQTKEEKRIVGDLLSDMGLAMIFVRYTGIVRDDECVFQYNSECFRPLQTLLWEFTTASKKLRIECGKTRVVLEITKDLISHRNVVGREDGQVPEQISASLGILQNCAKEQDNFRYFEEAMTAQALYHYAEELDEVAKMLAVLALSHVMNDKDKGSKGRFMIDFITEYLTNALHSRDHRFHGFSAEELVDGLSHLARNDKNKILILQSRSRVLDTLAELMENGCEEEKRVSTKAVYTLSFAIGNDIRSHSKIMRLLEEFEKGTETFSESAVGALLVLRNCIHVPRIRSDACPFDTDSCEGDTQTKNKEFSIKANDEEKHIMISYNWSFKSTAKKIHQRLCQQNYRVWIDDESMRGSILDSMAEAIEKSAAIVMCISRKYKESNNCQLEAKYAKSRDVPLIPVHVEQGYKPDGWLGMLQSDLFYIDLSNDANFEKEFQNLVKAIGERGKCSEGDAASQPNPFAKQSCQLEEVDSLIVPVEEWSVQDVNDWATSQNLDEEIFRDLDGKGLAFLRKLKEVAPAVFYRIAAGQVDLSKVRNVMKMSDAIEDLDAAKYSSPATT